MGKGGWGGKRVENCGGGGVEETGLKREGGEKGDGVGKEGGVPRESGDCVGNNMR